MPKPKRESTPVATATPAQVLLETEMKRVMQKLIDKALTGNLTALRLCVERVIPIPRERNLPVRIPAVESAVEITVALGGVFDALSQGQLTASEAQKLASILETQRRTIETTLLEERLKALEENSDGDKHKTWTNRTSN